MASTSTENIIQSSSSAVSSSSVNARRKKFISGLLNEIRQNESVIKINKNSSLNFSTYGSGNAEYNENRILRANESIKTLEDKNVLIMEKIKKIENGECDNEINMEFKKNKEYIVKREEKIKHDKELEIAYKNADKILSDAYNENIRSENYNIKSLTKEYNRFLDVINTLPPNIIKNIETTPCNRGYKWRGVIFYGNLPEQKPDMIFEKVDGGTKITEITDIQKTVYIKYFSGQKVLIEKWKRVINENAPSTYTRLS